MTALVRQTGPAPQHSNGLLGREPAARIIDGALTLAAPANDEGETAGHRSVLVSRRKRRGRRALRG